MEKKVGRFIAIESNYYANPYDIVEKINEGLQERKKTAEDVISIIRLDDGNYEVFFRE